MYRQFPELPIAAVEPQDAWAHEHTEGPRDLVAVAHIAERPPLGSQGVAGARLHPQDEKRVLRKNARAHARAAVALKAGACAGGHEHAVEQREPEAALLVGDDGD